LIKPNHLVFEIHKNVTSSQTIKRYTQNQSLKWTQRTMGKAILILQRVDFYFQNTRQSKDYIEWRVLGLRPKSWFLKDLFQNWHHSDFISTIGLEYTWHWKYEIWFQNKKDCRTNWICKILDRNDINSSQHSLKSWNTLGQYSGSREGKQVVFGLAGGQRKMIKWRISE